MWEAAKEAMKVWLVKEENHTEEIKKVIVDNIEGKYRFDVETWDKAFRYECGRRLLRGRQINDDLGMRLAKIKMPGLILEASNAPIHMVEEAVRKSLKESGKSARAQEAEETMQKVIMRLVALIEYSRTYKEELRADSTVREGLENT